MVLTKVAAAYANETVKILCAELEIAERKYQQQLLAMQLCKMHVLKTRRKMEVASHDVMWFDSQPCVADIDDPDWHAPSASLHYSSDSPPDVCGH